MFLFSNGQFSPQYGISEEAFKIKVSEVQGIILVGLPCWGNKHTLTFGTWGLNSTALCIASTALISAVLSPLLEAVSGENLQQNPEAH